MCWTSLIVLSNKWKQTKCPTVKNSINNSWHRHVVRILFCHLNQGVDLSNKTNNDIIGSKQNNINTLDSMLIQMTELINGKGTTLFYRKIPINKCGKDERNSNNCSRQDPRKNAKN